MSLNLNPTPQNYKAFEGRNIDKMPELLAEGRNPLSVSGLMETRLKYGKDLSHWMDNYFDTGDAIVYHPDGRIKVILDSKDLREINPESKLSSGGLILPHGVYDKLQGQEFTRSELDRFTGNSLSAKAVKKNPLWQTLARDQNLLDEYTNFIFSEAKNKFQYKENMGIYVDSTLEDLSILKAWCVSWLDDGSYAGGRFDLGFGKGRFVGVSTGGAKESKK